MIVCIGDSITYGQRLPDRAKAWPNLIDGVVAEYGVPGDTTRLGLERFPSDVQACLSLEGSHGVVIQFGHNDANRWETDRGVNRVSPGAFKANLIEMVDRVRVFGGVPFLCSLTPTHRSHQLAEDVVHYDQIIRRVADEESVRLIDVRMAFMAYDPTKTLMEDKLHLSELGHEVYARTVQAAITAATRG